MGSPGPRRTGRRSTPIDSKLPRPHPIAAPIPRSRSARASSRTLRELTPRHGRLAGRRAKGTGRRRIDRDVHLERAVESVPHLLFRLTDEVSDALREDRGGGIQEVARVVEGPGSPENSVQRTAGEARRNEADRIRGHLHGLNSHYADGDSQPSPLASACGVVSAQLSTYEGSRWAKPCVVIRMLSKYVSSITASRPCTFPRAARERSAALPCGLCGVEPGWNVKDPSSTTPSRAP